MRQQHLLALSLALAALSVPVLSATQPQSQPPAKTTTKKHADPAPQPPDEGERVFVRNCSRCHATPEGFSPSISGTIVRHMRVRANLSQHDEQALLRFLNP